MELWHKIFLITAGIGNLSLAVFILLKGRRRRVHITFSVFLFASVLWILSVYFALRFGTENLQPSLARIFGKLTFAFGSLTLSSFLVFDEVFPVPCDVRKLHRRMLLYYALGITAFVFSLTPALQRDVLETEEGILQPRFGWGLYVWGVFMVWTTVYGFYKLVSKYLRIGPGHEKTQLRYTFLGLALVGVVAFFVNLLMFLFNGGSLGTVSVGPAMTMFMVVLITFAIVRHRLMDLGVVFRSALIYSIVIVILAGINLTILSVLTRQLGLPFLVSVVLASTVVVLTLVPVRDKVEEVCYLHIFKMRRHGEIVEELSGDLTRILDLDGLRRVVVDKLVDILQLETGSMLISDRIRGGYSVFYSTRAEEPGSAPLYLDDQSMLIRKLVATGRMVLLTDLKRELNESEYGMYAVEFEELGAAALLPLSVKDVLIGVIALGPKQSGDIFSYEDINMLSLLGNHMAAALENSQLFDEILAVKNHYGSILQHLRSGVITMHPDRTINTINQRARNILNLGDARLEDEPVEGLGKVLANILVGRQTTSVDFFDQEVFLDVDGRGEVPLGIICTVMRDEKDPPGVLMVFEDLTVEKQLQARIRRADRLASIGTLAAGMAHEIKNPLVSIKTFTQLLPEKFDDKDFREQFSSITFQEVERINRIVEQLLNFARPMRPNPSPSDLHRVIDEVLAVLDEDIGKRQVKIIRRYMDTPAVVMVDSNQMKQVFMNVFMNSLHALDWQGRIEVATEFIYGNKALGDGDGGDAAVGAYGTGDMTQRWLKVTVTDNGKGVPKEMLPNLIDPFFTTRTEGFGLGLAIVHGILVEHNATIEIDSEETQWTRVTVKIPAQKTHGTEL